MKLLKAIIAVIYIALLIVMGWATFAEKAEGTDFVHQHCYGAWWFAALWAALAICGAVKVFKDFRVFKDFKDSKVVILHLSFLIILLGAGITHFTGRTGTIHLRLNEPQDIADIKQSGRHYLHRLNFSVELTEFRITEDETGNVKDYRSAFTLTPALSLKGEGDEKIVSAEVSMNNIYKYGSIRFYQMSYDYDQRGATLMINRDPYGIPVTYCGYALLFLSFIWLCLSKSRILGSSKFRSSGTSNLRPKRFLIPFLSLLLTAAWCVYYFVLDGSWTQIPVLRHPLLVFHVVIIILAYALLLIQTIISAAYFFRTLRNPRAPMNPYPPVNSALLRWALCFLSIGIFLGAIWANISWGNYWTWDSKETWALITVMIYAVPLHKRSLPVFSRPRVYHVYMLLAFLTVLMTYFGVNYFLTGMHSYA